jgi:hypothetical protein
MSAPACRLIYAHDEIVAAGDRFFQFTKDIPNFIGNWGGHIPTAADKARDARAVARFERMTPDEQRDWLRKQT